MLVCVFSSSRRSASQCSWSDGKTHENGLEMESGDSDEDSCSDADSNEEESTSLPRQETDFVAHSGIQVKRSEIQRERSVKRNKEPQKKI